MTEVVNDLTNEERFNLALYSCPPSIHIIRETQQKTGCAAWFVVDGELVFVRDEPSVEALTNLKRKFGLTFGKINRNKFANGVRIQITVYVLYDESEWILSNNAMGLYGRFRHDESRVVHSVPYVCIQGIGNHTIPYIDLYRMWDNSITCKLIGHSNLNMVNSHLNSFVINKSTDISPGRTFYKSGVKSVYFSKPIKLTCIYRMFADCARLNTLVMSTVDLSEVRDAREAFCNCELLSFVDISTLPTTAVVTGMYNGSGLPRIYNDFCTKLGITQEYCRAARSKRTRIMTKSKGLIVYYCADVSDREKLCGDVAKSSYSYVCTSNLVFIFDPTCLDLKSKCILFYCLPDECTIMLNEDGFLDEVYSSGMSKYGRQEAFDDAWYTCKLSSSQNDSIQKANYF